MRGPLLFVPLLLFQLLACRPAENSGTDRILAKVYSKTLYLSELESMIPSGMSAEDSALIINAYTERWVREAAMMHEAERNIPQDLNIDELVRDYRASLILHNYEKKLVGQLLDSTVTQSELQGFYEKNKEQYKLDEPILRCHFIKINKTAPDIDLLEDLWQKSKSDVESFDQMVDYCNEYSQAHLLEDSTWHRISEVEVDWQGNKLPQGSLQPGAELTRTDNTYKYFLRVIDFVPSGTLPPISYVKDQAKKVILHKRKMELLSDTKEDMYEEALRKNAIKIYRD